MKNFIFTSESVCSGHPDKVCDRISDAIVDEVLSLDPKGRVAVETLVTTNKVILAGEVKVKGLVDFEKIARAQIKELGYTNPDYQFSDQSSVEVFIHQQSAEIAKGVNKKGAGDQGMMFGFACNDTKELMPMPIFLAHQLARAIDKARETKLLPYLRPDGKSQVTIRYEEGKPVKVETVVVAVPHDPKVSYEQVKADVLKLVNQVLGKVGFSVGEKQLILNGTGVWHQGGPATDTGVTGRKIVVDTYGGFAKVGGGAFSGKDPSKVDRSGAYFARFLAKQVVANKLADKCEVSLAYVIGRAKPVMVEVETFGTEKVSLDVIKDLLKKYDPSVEAIIDFLDLRNPIYKSTSAYGHFGRKGFSWEKVIK